MIRHLTSLEVYERILEEGIIKPSDRDGRDKGTISFEKYQGNNQFVSIFTKLSKYSNSKIIGIFIDEKRLQADEYKIFFTDSSSVQSRKLSKHTTKYENILEFNGNEAAEGYKKIGEYVHVEGSISLEYIEKIENY